MKAASAKSDPSCRGKNMLGDDDKPGSDGNASELLLKVLQDRLGLAFGNHRRERCYVGLLYRL